MRVAVIIIVLALALVGCSLWQGDSAMTQKSGDKAGAAGPKPRAVLGAYYFEGWAGHTRHGGDAAWAKNAPMQLTERMVKEFPEREPVWGWRDDSVEIMEQQIDLAADAGIQFFAFCWYWFPDPERIADSPLNSAVPLFLKARNHKRMKFCLLVANHKPFDPPDDAAWKKAMDGWMGYLTDASAMKIGGKPMVIIYAPSNGTKGGFDHLQEQAKKAGLPGVAVVACGKGDVATGYGYKSFYNLIPGYTWGAQEHPFKDLVEAHEKEWSGTAEQPFIPQVTSGWDKRPWEGPTGLGQKEGWYFPDRSPAKVAAFLEDAIGWMDAHPKETTPERVVMIYAWNELGEGGYLMPTKGDPEGAYLKAIHSVIYAPRGAPKP